MLPLRPLLLQPIILALFTGIVTFIIPGKFRVLRHLAAFVSGLLIFLNSLRLFILRPLEWFVKGEIFFNLDAFSGIIFLAISILGFVIILYSLGLPREKEYQSYYSYIFWTIGIAQAAVLSNNIIAFMAFWGFLGLTMYLLLNQGGPEAAPVAKKAFIMVAGADGFLILGLAILGRMSETINMHEINVPVSGRLSTISFLCILIAALTRAGAVPFHTRIPDMAEKGPVAVTAFFPAALDKLLGIYLLGRICLSLYKLNQTMQMLLLIIGAFTVITAVSMALVQNEVKRFLGYQTISQVGYTVLGFGTGTALGIIGGIFHLVNSSIYNCLLFLSAGVAFTPVEVSRQRRLPYLWYGLLTGCTFMAALVGSLAISGVPPFNGFVSNWMIYQSIISLRVSGHKLWVIWLGAAMFGSALTLASFIKILRAVFLGPRPDNLKGKETGWPQAIAMVILSLLAVSFGLLAFRLPLPYISEMVDESLAYSEMWRTPLAMIFILIALGIGGIIYLWRGVKALPCPTIYDLAGKKVFDIYDLTARGIFYLAGLIKKMHSGILWTYLSWVLFGFLALLVIFLENLF